MALYLELNFQNCKLCLILTVSKCNVSDFLRLCVYEEQTPTEREQTVYLFDSVVALRSFQT